MRIYKQPERFYRRIDRHARTLFTGIAHLFAMPMGGQVLLSMRFYLYGQQASAIAGEVEPLWQDWVHEYFPAAPGAA